VEHLIKISQKEERLVVGLMSGTSVDGVDAALVKIRGSGLDCQLTLEHFSVMPYPAGLKEFILEHSRPGSGSVDGVCRLNAILGEIFAQATMRVITEAGRRPPEVDLIGSHGQTVHHLPEEAELFGQQARSTLQLGEPSIIAKRTGIVTVADFRPADLALGGQGAPLVPYFDYVVFRSQEESRALLNIGGIANLTVLPRGCGLEEIFAFDTGPGNMLIDALTQHHFGRAFDDHGEIARRGKIHRRLLSRLLEHPYFSQTPPKSTGRELFGASFLTHFHEAAVSPEDAIATATALTAESIVQAIDRFVSSKASVDRLIVSGGGSKNRFLLSLLRQALPAVAIETSDDYGIPADAKEAMCFALLANETIADRPGNVPSCTGATQPTILGKICL
jgi:anhydro-N-acetylmuramic acid kinase